MSNKNSKLGRRLAFIIFLLFGAALGYFLGKAGVVKSGGGSRVSALLVIIFLIPTFFLVIAIHEAGHAVAGIWMKFDFKMYVVGPFLWKKENGRWSFHWNKNINTAGGLVICLPTTETDLAKRFSIYAAGGPVFSLVFALLTFALYKLITIQQIFTATNTAFKPALTLLFLLSVFSALIFLVTIIPVHSGGFSSDGARIINLLKGGARARFELLILKLITKSSSGTRPADYNLNELEEAKNLAIQLNAPFGVYIHGFLYQCHFDRGEQELAEQHLSDYISAAEMIPVGIRNSIWLDAAFFYGIDKKDPEKARYFWGKFKPSALISKAQLLATEAVIAHLDHNHEQALSKAQESIANLGNMLDKGSGVMIGDKMRDFQKLVSANYE